MILKFIDYVTGYYKVSVCAKDVEMVMNILLKNNFIGSAPVRERDKSDGEMGFVIIARHIKKLREVFAVRHIEAEISHIMGLPHLFELYKKRLGVFIGIAYFFAMVWASTFFIWDMNVSGNRQVSDAEIIELLDEVGCGVGSLIPAIDFDELRNRYLLNSPNIAWISVNMNGVTAEVEVREIMPGGARGDESAANIVASADGQIDIVEVFSGKKAVNIGDVVKKGDLLISGVIGIGGTAGQESIEYERAAGKVIARVIKDISIKIPMEQEQKVFTKERKSSYLINIFGKSVKFFSNSGISGGNCDKIVEKKQIVIFGEIFLPVNIITETYNEYEMQTVRLSEEKAVELAFVKLRSEMDAALAGEDTELLERQIDSSYDGENFILTCSLYCLENIAQTAPFDADHMD